MWLCAMRRDNLTNQRTDLVHSIYKLLWSFWKAWGKSVIKVFLYNCLTWLRSQTAASTSERSDSIYCVTSALSEAQIVYIRAGATGGREGASLGLSRPLTQDNRFYLWNIMVYLKNTVAKRIGFLALIWCYYSKHLGQSVSQSRILITSDTQTSSASGSTKCRHYAALLTKLKVW